MESAQKKPSDAGDGGMGGGSGGGDRIDLGQKHVIDGTSDVQTDPLSSELTQDQ
jgi:hypothetical protein